MRELTPELLEQIDDTTQEVFDLATRRDARRKEGSRRTVYEKAIRETGTTAGKPAATALAQWIQAEIEEKQRFPSGRAVRRQGAEICRELGHEISTGSWLGA